LIELKRITLRVDQNPSRQGAEMPIYEYVCDECKREFEALVRSDTVPECPTCHSKQLEKKLSVFATAASESVSSVPDPCGSCGHFGGPGACGLN
jgi:putative FmdB family regulatory protein